MDPINALILKSFLILAVFSLSSLILSNCRFWRKMKDIFIDHNNGNKSLVLVTRHIHKILLTPPPPRPSWAAHFVEMLKREHVATMRERGLASKLPQAFSNKPTRVQGIMFMFTFVTTQLCIFLCACCLLLI